MGEPAAGRWWLLLLVLLVQWWRILPTDGVPTSNSTIQAGDPLHVGVILPLKTYPCYALAALYAVKDVNSRQVMSFSANQPRLLPNNNMTVSVNDSQSDSSVTLAAALWQMETKGAFALIGELTSGITAPMATLASAFSTPVIAPQATLDSFSQKAIYPYFSRVVGSDENQAYALHSMMIYYQWKEAQIVHSSDSYGTSFAADLQSVAGIQAKNGTGVRFNSVNSFVSGDPSSILNAILAMDTDGSPIVVLAASHSSDMRVFASTLISHGLLGRYQYVSSDGFFHRTTISGTPPGQRANYTAFLRGIVGTLPVIPDSPGATQLNVRMRSKELCSGNALIEAAAPSCSMTDTTPSYVYDAVLAIARAAAAVDQAGEEISGVHVQNELLSGRVEFDGLTGMVQIGVNGDRLASYSLTNYKEGDENIAAFGAWTQASGPEASAALVGTNPYTITTQYQPTFVDGTHTPPSYLKPRPLREPIDQGTTDGLIGTSVVFGVVIGLLPMLFVTWHRDHLAIKTANVPLTCLFLFGTIIGCCYPAAASLPLSPTSSHSVASTCLLPLFLLALSFDVMFSALLTKTLVVLSISSNTQLRIQRRSHWRSVRITAALVVLDTAIWLAWGLTDHPRLVKKVFESGGSDFYACGSDFTLLWQLLVILPKFLLLGVTAVVCYRIRDVSVQFGESKLLAWILNQILFIAGLTIVLINVISDPEASLVISSLALFFCLTFSVSLLIIPKALLVLGSGASRNPHGLTMVQTGSSGRPDGTLTAGGMLVTIKPNGELAYSAGEEGDGGGLHTMSHFSTGNGGLPADSQAPASKYATNGSMRMESLSDLRNIPDANRPRSIDRPRTLSSLRNAPNVNGVMMVSGMPSVPEIQSQNGTTTLSSGGLDSGRGSLIDPRSSTTERIDRSQTAASRNDGSAGGGGGSHHSCSPPPTSNVEDRRIVPMQITPSLLSEHATTSSAAASPQPNPRSPSCFPLETALSHPLQVDPSSSSGSGSSASPALERPIRPSSRVATPEPFRIHLDPAFTTLRSDGPSVAKVDPEREHSSQQASRSGVALMAAVQLQ